MQLNSDLQPYMKAGATELLSFSLSAAPVVFHRQLVGEERWRQQLQQVRPPTAGWLQSCDPPALFVFFLCLELILFAD